MIVVWKRPKSEPCTLVLASTRSMSASTTRVSRATSALSASTSASCAGRSSSAIAGPAARSPSPNPSATAVSVWFTCTPQNCSP